MRTAEEAVLLSALNGDHDDVLERLKTFLPGERRSLEKACLMIIEVMQFELPEETGTERETNR